MLRPEQAVSPRINFRESRFADNSFSWRCFEFRYVPTTSRFGKLCSARSDKAIGHDGDALRCWSALYMVLDGRSDHAQMGEVTGVMLSYNEVGGSPLACVIGSAE
jgi:hypothetical protein